MLASKDHRDEFVIDFAKMMTECDIPLEKARKMKPFVVKHCKQGGALPNPSTLRRLYVPRLFASHIATLKTMLHGKSVTIIVDETTDIRDKSILNVVAGKPYLIDVVTMQACNHATLRQAVIQAVTSIGIEFKDVLAVVTDSAAYCKKAHREVLSAVFTDSVHVLCLAHIVNLAGDIFQKWPEFGRIATLTSMVKSSFFKKPARKGRYIDFLVKYPPKEQVKLPPVPCSTRWNTWFEAVAYHASHMHVYNGFYKGRFYANC